MPEIKFENGKIRVIIELTDPDCLLPHVTHVGDDLSVELAFHIAEWQNNFGTGTYTLLLKPPDDTAAYYVNCTVSGEYATYTLTSSDLRYAGCGRMQLRGVFSGSKKKLTHVWDLEIIESLSGNGTSPSPWDDIIDKIEGYADTASEAAETAESLKDEIEEVVEKFVDITAEATTLPAGSAATASYSSTDNEFSFGIPQGIKGDTGAGVLPGGTAGQILLKVDSTDFNMSWIDMATATHSIPAGGTSGQILAKTDGTDYNAQWVDNDPGVTSFNDLTNRPTYNGATMTSATSIPEVPVVFVQDSEPSSPKDGDIWIDTDDVVVIDFDDVTDRPKYNGVAMTSSTNIPEVRRPATYTATIGTTWTGSEAPYTQTITVSGILADDVPIVDLVPSSTYSTAEDEIEDWAKIYKMTVTDANTIIVYATEETTVDMTVQLRCVR